MKCVILFILAIAAAPAAAQPYISMGVASVATTAIGPVRDEKQTGAAWRVAGGWRLEQWAGELATTVDTNRLASLAALRWVGPFYVKAGAAYASGSQAVRDPGPVPPVPAGGRPAVDAERARTWAGITWVAGVGAEVPLYKNGGLRLDAERIGRVDQLRAATQFSAGIAIHF